jgi:DNA-binding NarL/FixJ family response regulator
MPEQCKGNGPASVRPIRIVLAAAFTLIRQATALVLRSEAAIQVVGEAGSGPKALDLVRRLRPDVILMEIDLPGINGIEVARQLRAAFPEVAVIGFSMYEGGEDAMRQAGARAFVSKSASVETLLAAIRATRAQDRA